MKTTFKPARPDLKIPMPGRAGMLMPDTGIQIDPMAPFFRRMIRDGDIVPVETETAGKPGKANK